MKIKIRAIVAPLLLGCVLLISGLVSGEEIMTCNRSGQQLSAAAKPGIAIKKDSNAAAEQDAWTYKITNTGNVDLINVRVTDERFADITCQQAELGVGESMRCTASGLAQSVKQGMGCAVADHVVMNEVGVMVTTKGDCDQESAQIVALNH